MIDIEIKNRVAFILCRYPLGISLMIVNSFITA